MDTLYEQATNAMQQSIFLYLKLASDTNEFQTFSKEILASESAKQLIMAGKSLNYVNITPNQCLQELSRVKNLSNIFSSLAFAADFTPLSVNFS